MSVTPTRTRPWKIRIKPKQKTEPSPRKMNTPYKNNSQGSTLKSTSPTIPCSFPIAVIVGKHEQNLLVPTMKPLPTSFLQQGNHTRIRPFSSTYPWFCHILHSHTPAFLCQIWIFLKMNRILDLRLVFHQMLHLDGFSRPFFHHMPP